MPDTFHSLCSPALAGRRAPWARCCAGKGMLAYRLPVPVYYHIPTVIFSLVAAICASFIALFVVSRERVTILNIVAGGLLMAAGISTMHYTGMAAMRLSAMHHYDGRLLLVSLSIALFVSWAVLVWS